MYLVQEKIALLPYQDQAALYHTACGFMYELPEDWLRKHAGETVGCPHCGQNDKLPETR